MTTARNSNPSPASAAPTSTSTSSPATSSAPSGTDRFAVHEQLSDREIILSRVFDAPPELVWKVWTDSRHINNWWGPQGFTNTTHTMEVRPGGIWRFVMHGPDGRDYDNLITYLEVSEPRRLRYKHGGDVECEPVNFEVEVNFEPLADGRQTRLTIRMVFPSKDAKDFVVREYNALKGGHQHLGRLGDYLQKEFTASQAGSRFVFSRVFRAPREAVFAAWTRRESLAAWFGPAGCTITARAFEPRPGGIFHYTMHMTGGADMHGKWVFREITPTTRLVFVNSFADAAGNVIRPPFDDDWPREMLTEVTFADHAGIGRGTVVTVSWTLITPTESERATFESQQDSMRQGWGGTCDKLDEFLSRG